MAGSLNRHLVALSNTRDAKELRRLFETCYDRLSSQINTSAGLAIKTGGSAIVKAGTVIYGTADGIMITKAANTDMAALSGTVANAMFNIFAFFVDRNGLLTSAMGTAGATLAAAKFPTIPYNPLRQAIIGYIIVNPTGTGSFVGGTTALDDATVVPNVVYVNVIGAFDPSATFTI